MSSTDTPAPRRRHWSLRARLLRPFVTACAVIWLASAVLVFVIAEREASADWDLALLRSGHSLLAFVEHEYAEAGGQVQTLQEDSHFPFEGYLVQVWTRAGAPVLRSADAPVQRLMEEREGFAALHLYDQDWRVASLWSHSGEMELLIAENGSRRGQEALALGLSLLVPVIVGLPIIGLLAWGFTNRALRPFTTATQQLARRDADGLDPLLADDLPAEVQPLVSGFNMLLRRLRAAYSRERRFASDVAHEIRTPLATVRLNAEILGVTARDAGSSAAAERIVQAVDRTTRVLDQLLTLARLELPEFRHEAFDLRRIAEECVGEFASRISAKQQQLSLDCQGAPGTGPQQAAYIVLRNLLENAIRHAPQQGQIRISTLQDASHWSISVEDSGSGFDPGQELRAPHAARAESGSARLGLGLVRRVADTLGAYLVLDRSPTLGGARAVLAGPGHRQRGESEH